LLPREVAEDVILTLKGSSAMARNAVGLEQALHRTQAAEHARSERRRRKNRTVDVGGGAVYAEDCRKMAAQRVINEAAKQEAAVAARHLRALSKRINTWKRIRPNIRNWGKKASKRYAEGLTITQNNNKWTYTGPTIKYEREAWEYRVEDPSRAEIFRRLYENSIQRLESRGKFRADRSIADGPYGAAELGLMARCSMDPYTILIHQKGRSEVKQEAIVQVPDSQFTIQETQVVSSDDDKGYSSPFEALNAAEADWGF
jgi:hypothetical protein